MFVFPRECIYSPENVLFSQRMFFSGNCSSPENVRFFLRENVFCSGECSFFLENVHFLCWRMFSFLENVRCFGGCVFFPEECSFFFWRMFCLFREHVLFLSGDCF